jgi:RNA polymerase sigma factor (TIGR02999 family)
MDQPGDITGLLAQWRKGDSAVEAQIVDAVYNDLHRIARRYARNERAGHSLQATALVNEAYLRLVARRTSWKNRAHFFGVAAVQMRRILIDYARRNRAAKRGDGIRDVTLDVNSVEASPRGGLSATHLDNVLGHGSSGEREDARGLRYRGSENLPARHSSDADARTGADDDCRVCRAREAACGGGSVAPEPAPRG